MNRSSELKPEAFRYGFLTSKAARILYEYSSGNATAENLLILDRAQDFVSQILNGEALVSGEKEGLNPSIEALQAFHYGIKALNVMQRLHELKNRQELRDTLSDIQETLNAVKKGLSNGKRMPVKKLRTAADFFNVIADALLTEASEYPSSEMISRV